jgi:RoxA-like, cytochrome c-like
MPSPMRAAVIGALALTTGALVACSPSTPPPGAPTTPTAEPPAVAQYSNGWDDSDRRVAYHLSTGGEVLSLALLQSLERSKLPQEGSDSQLIPFLQNIERYGFIADPMSNENSFGLPVGWTVARSLLDATVLTGFNCTACHVGQVHVGDKRLRIDGGPNLLRINDLFQDLTTELMATLGDPPRMAKLTANLIRNHDANTAKLPSSGGSAAQRLQQKMEALPLVKASLDYLRSMKTVGEMGAVENGAVDNGYGRVDAFGVARNLLFGGDQRNLRPQNAPVSFPYMWGLRTTAWLQWGANINSVMERNIGQTLGVGARFDASTFATTSRLDNLNTIEKRVYKLTAPEWKEDLLGAIDRAKADRGRPMYEKLCSNCHDRPFAVSPTGLVSYQLFRLNEVGTSPVVATNFDRTVITPQGERRLPDAAFEAIEAIKQQYYKANNVSPETQADWEGRDMRPLPQWKPSFRSTLAEADKYPDTKGGRVYPAKPLAGIWATAPYLNNGSVANMWDLLTRPETRPKTFFLGSREYDTRALGYRSASDAPSAGPLFLYDTTKAGNSNAGHVYGTQLTDDDKWALIEFMKILKPGEFKKQPVSR